jgi:hypothetical protein
MGNSSAIFRRNVHSGEFRMMKRVASVGLAVGMLGGAGGAAVGALTK